MRFGSDTVGLLIAVIALLIGAATSNIFGAVPEPTDPQASVRRPIPTPPPSVRAPAPVPPSGGPDVTIEIGPKKDSSGSAFPVAVGVWMTARHVTEGCLKLGVVTDSRRAVRGDRVQAHGNADLALFRSSVRAAPVAVGGEDLTVGQSGYHFGFPKGEPGAMRSRLLGSGTMRLSGRYSTREPILAWAEVERVPDSDGSLSGISGGPVFDAAGHLVGVHVAGSLRRGRSFTTAPQSIRELWAQAGIAPAADGPVPPITDRNFASVGERLRHDLVVAKVICLTH